MPTTIYRWRIIKEGPNPGPWKSLGKPISYPMSEEDAREHEKRTGRVLEKIFGSGQSVGDDLYGPQGYGANIPAGPSNGGKK